MGRRRETDTEKRTLRSGDAEKRGCVIDRCTGFSRVADAARIRTTALSAHPRVSVSPNRPVRLSPRLPFSPSIFARVSVSLILPVSLTVPRRRCRLLQRDSTTRPLHISIVLPHFPAACRQTNNYSRPTV